MSSRMVSFGSRSRISVNTVRSSISSTTKRSPNPKTVAELPYIRYRKIDGKTKGEGGTGGVGGAPPDRRLPQRIAAKQYHQGTNPRSSTKKSTDDPSRLNKKFRSPRRVRFTLPTTDGVSRTISTTCTVPPPIFSSSTTTTSSSNSRINTDRYTTLPRRQNNSNSVVVLDRKPRDGFSRFSSRSESKEKRRDGEKQRRDVGVRDDYDYESFLNGSTTSVLVTASPGVRNRVQPTGRYLRGTLSPTATALPHAAASPESQALLRAARDGDDHLLRDLLRTALHGDIAESDLNAVDSSGRTILSYIASNGSIDLLEQILHLPGLDPNKPDNEGNSPLHFAAQAGQIECLNCMLSRCRGIEIDARNNLGFTPLMKAALQGRNKCAKLLLFGGANPTLRDNGRGFRADQWARFCGRYVCADVIEKHARQRLLERSTSYGNWGGDNELGARVLMGKVIPIPIIPQQQSQGLKSKLRKVFRTSSGPTQDTFSSARLVTQLTSAALCASSPVLPSGPTCPPVVKSLIRPLTVPRLQITLVNNNADLPNNNNNNGTAKSQKGNAHVTTTEGKEEATTGVIKPARSKKKK